MMEIRKEREVEHYDRLAREWQAKSAAHPEFADLDIETVNVMKMASYQKLYELLKQYVPGKKVLDYGCGHGMHTVELAKIGAAEVVGIDLSEESLKIAEERIEKSTSPNLYGRIDLEIRFLKMDGEALEFPNNSFDIVFDGGTFSSIDLEKGLQEIHRVLKPGGLLIGIETLGHHPLANLKRWFNKKRGIRTTWAASHILRMNDLKLMERYFKPEKLAFFHFFSLLVIPFQRFPGGQVVSSVADAIDKFLFTVLPFTKRYGFKVVFVFKNRK